MIPPELEELFREQIASDLLTKGTDLRRLNIQAAEKSFRNGAFNAQNYLASGCASEIQHRAGLIVDAIHKVVLVTEVKPYPQISSDLLALFDSEFEKLEAEWRPRVIQAWQESWSLGSGSGRPAVPAGDGGLSADVAKWKSGHRMNIKRLGASLVPPHPISMVRLFISHSSDDADLAALIVRLFSQALGLRSQNIRCTSVDGYRLPGGADADEQLRDEALGAECFVGMLSSQSLSSAYVLFELGARWGAKKHLVPLLAPGMKAHALRGPLKGLNALSSDSSSELHQLVQELGAALKVEVESPAVYQRDLEAVVYYSTTREVPVPAPPLAEASATPTTGVPKAHPEDDYAEADEVTERNCEREWPDDYNMRAHCLKQQQSAVAELRAREPADVPEEVFRQIRRKCAREWPDDYNMRNYSEEQQIAAYRKLHPPKRK